MTKRIQGKLTLPRIELSDADKRQLISEAELRRRDAPRQSLEFARRHRHG